MSNKDISNMRLTDLHILLELITDEIDKRDSEWLKLRHGYNKEEDHETISNI